MKKFLALIISLSMILMCVPGISLVASAMEGEGTPDNPYVIAEAADFLAVFAKGGSLAANTNAYFVQTADITLGEYAPDNTVEFAGTYDAQGNTITYTISSTADNKGNGAFGRVVGGTIKNLTVAGSMTSNKQFLGGVAGYSDGATFINCTNNVAFTFTSGANFIGGIAGGSLAAKAPSTFTNCVNNANLNVPYATVGGILGYGFGTITKCTNNGQINSNSYGASAGILAQANADTSVADTASVVITKCNNTKSVKNGSTNGANVVSGILAEVKAVNSVSISECYNTGEVNGNGKTDAPSSVAPMIARINNTMAGENPSVTVANCYNTATWNTCVATRTSGGAIGSQLSTNAVVTLSSYFDAWNWGYQYDIKGYEVESNPIKVGKDVYYVNVNGVALNEIKQTCTIISVADMKAGLPEGFSSDYWISFTGKYPMLKCFADGSGSGTSDADPIIVASGETFAAYFGKNVAADKLALVDGTTDYNTSGADNRYFLQICDITLPEGYAPHTTQTKWVYYNGNGYTINVDIKAADVIGNNVGIFGNTKWSNMKNVVIDGTIDATGYENVGGLLGYSDGGYFENITNKADVTGKAKVGGIIGYHSNAGNGTKNLTNYGEITGSGDEVGGITGSGYISAALKGYTNYGAVKGGNKVGGIWGVTAREATVTVTNFANIGTVTGMNSVGGIFGVVARADLTVAESYNAGAINGNDDYYAAAIIAYLSSTGNITITDCFNTGIINTPNGAKGSAVTAVDIAGITVTVTNYYDAANKDIEVVELTNKSNGIEETDTTAVVTNAYILNASIKLDKAGAGESILAADLADKEFGANWVAPKGVLAYPQLANVEYKGLAVAEVAPAAIAAGTAAVVKAEVVLEGETYNNAAVFAAKILGDAAKYGFEVTYTNSGKVEPIYAKNAVPGLTEGYVYGLLVYNIPEDSEIIVKSFVEFDGVKYYGAAQKAFFAAPVAE